MIKIKTFDFNKAQRLQPIAIEAMLKRDLEVMDTTVRELLEGYQQDNVFWLDPRGWLHVDDRLHPAYDDVFNPTTAEWQGDDLGCLDYDTMTYPDDWADRIESAEIALQREEP